jgi:hypothetical protein
MRTIRISEPVWQAIAERGNFGETEDDVLRRVFNLPEHGGLRQDAAGHGSIRRGGGSSRRRNFARQRMSASVTGGALQVSFAEGEAGEWSLPERSDKLGIRRVRDGAVAFARERGATIGQQNAVKKALTEEGYHLTK